MTDLAAATDTTRSFEANRATGAVIRSARIGLHLSQTQLATEAGISKSYLSHIEAGRRPVSDELLRRLLDLTGVGDPNHGQPMRIRVEAGGQVLEVSVKGATVRDGLLAAAALTTDAWTETP